MKTHLALCACIALTTLSCGEYEYTSNHDEIRRLQKERQALETEPSTPHTKKQLVLNYIRGLDYSQINDRTILEPLHKDEFVFAYMNFILQMHKLQDGQPNQELRQAVVALRKLAVNQILTFEPDQTASVQYCKTMYKAHVNSVGYARLKTEEANDVGVVCIAAALENNKPYFAWQITQDFDIFTTYIHHSEIIEAVWLGIEDDPPSLPYGHRTQNFQQYCQKKLSPEIAKRIFEKLKEKGCWETAVKLASVMKFDEESSLVSEAKFQYFMSRSTEEMLAGNIASAFGWRSKAVTFNTPTFKQHDEAERIFKQEAAKLYARYMKEDKFMAAYRTVLQTEITVTIDMKTLREHAFREMREKGRFNLAELPDGQVLIIYE